MFIEGKAFIESEHTSQRKVSRGDIDNQSALLWRALTSQSLQETTHPDRHCACGNSVPGTPIKEREHSLQTTPPEFCYLPPTASSFGLPTPSCTSLPHLAYPFFSLSPPPSRPPSLSPSLLTTYDRYL